MATTTTDSFYQNELVNERTKAYYCRAHIVIPTFLTSCLFTLAFAVVLSLADEVYIITLIPEH